MPRIAEASDRTAAIEVGSRAVRVLVADVQGGILSEVWASSAPFRFPAGTPGQLSEAARTLASIVERFEDAAASHGARVIFTFGTAALRKAMATNDVEAILRHTVRVLSPEEEAGFSALAAASAVPEGCGRKVMLTIDQGAQSLELASSSLPVELSQLRCQTLPLGTEELLAHLMANGRSVAELLREVSADFSAAHPTPLEPFATVLQGSVPTKLAWLTKGEKGKYRPARVHGQKLDVRLLRRMLASFASASPQAWEEARQRFGGDGQDKLEVERVLAGAVQLSVILQSYRVEQFYVSSRGTRHGALLWRSGRNSPVEQRDLAAVGLSSPRPT